MAGTVSEPPTEPWSHRCQPRSSRVFGPVNVTHLASPLLHMWVGPNRDTIALFGSFGPRKVAPAEMSSVLDTPPSSGVPGEHRADIKARTLRVDRWWLAPALTAAALIAFVIYSTWRAFENANYYSAPLISPFYSPCLAVDCVPGSSEWTPVGAWWVLSPALLILIFPLGFRLTCY